MTYHFCDKCGKKVPFSGCIRAYSIAKKEFVRVCFACADDLTGY